MDDERPIPKPKNSVFAIWRWPRWTWAIVVPLAFAGYVLSTIPVLSLLVGNGIQSRFPLLYATVHAVYYPVLWAGRNSEFVALIIAWEQAATESALGYSF